MWLKLLGSVFMTSLIVGCAMDFSYVKAGTDPGPSASDTRDTSPFFGTDSTQDTEQQDTEQRDTEQQDTDGDTGTDLEQGWINNTVPYASGAAASAVLSDGLHYLGGSSHFYGNTIYRKHQVYDGATQTWKTSPTNIPDGDGWGARAHVYNDRLYLIGGYPSGSRMRVYDPNTNKWTAPGGLPADFQWGFASGIIGQALYVFGGEPQPAQNAPGYRYDFVKQSWSSVAPIPRNSGRGALSSAVVEDRLYVLNGNAGGETILQIYDAASDSWSLGPGLEGHSFEAAAAAVRGSSVYFFGGAKDHDIADSSGVAALSDRVNVYDTASGTWSTGAPMKPPKMWATAQFYGGKFYVLGGLNANSAQMNDLGIYTP